MSKSVKMPIDTEAPARVLTIVLPPKLNDGTGAPKMSNLSKIAEKMLIILN